MIGSVTSWITRGILAALLLCSTAFTSVAYSETTPELVGDPILWVSGKITNTNTPEGLVLDEMFISQMDMGHIATSNHVVEEVASYEGPTIESVLELAGHQGTDAKFIAWDDYVVTIPIETIKQYGLLLATHENGKRMTIDDKGPFFVVFPFTDNPELQNDLYYNLSVWQVREIIVE